MKGPYKSGAEENTFIKAYDDIERSSKGPIRGPEAYPLLEIVQGPKQGAWFTVAYQKELTLGRASTNSIMLEDNSVSRSHAVLQSTGHGFTVRDIGSRNGTFLNNKKIQGEMPVKHMDTIKVGIYTLRFMEEPSDEPFEGEAKEEHTPHTEPPAAPGPDASAAELLADLPEPEPEPEPVLPMGLELEQPEERIIPQEQAIVPQAAAPVAPIPPAATATKPPSKAARNLLILLVIFGILGGGGYLAYRSGALDKLKASLGGGKTKVTEKTKATTPGTPTGEKPKVLTPPVEGTAGQTVPVFIEADAKPVTAKVFYKEKELGTTPFKVSVQVPVGQPQELTAEYFLDGIGEKWTEKLSFQVQKQDEVVPANFQAKLGQLKVKSLPKNGELYLEGKFPPGATQAKPLKINNLSFDAPVYLPFGSYVAEVRMPETLEGSTSTVNSVKYRREFEMSAAASEFNLEASDEAIKSFPAQINTNPPGAEVLVDGKKMGDTPFAGQLPTGRHKLTIRKEGFNDFEKELTIELNTPYTANFNLATSPAGEFIN
ncbi:MAG TPA: FHA domain-containing protein, partial [bacterium]|nr:FHA domain-containing protein [bacterium]